MGLLHIKTTSSIFPRLRFFCLACFSKQSIDTKKKINSYLCRRINSLIRLMFKKIKELYNEYKLYVRVDLIMYGVMILLIIFYFVFSIIV